MHLYQGSTRQFIGDATQARIANLLSDRFFEEFRYRPAPSEVNSWRNSLGVYRSRDGMAWRARAGPRPARPRGVIEAKAIHYAKCPATSNHNASRDVRSHGHVSCA